MAARPRVGFLLGVIAAGLVLFLLPSAWLHARGVPYILCWIGGAIAFPLLPVGWHVWAERKRAKAAAVPTKGPVKPATSTLTPADRFTMRLILVAVVALGPLLFFRFGQTWRAVRDHGTWFVPEAPPAPRTFKGDQRVIAQVPGDAELVVWIRGIKELQGDMAKGDKGDRGARRDADQPDEALLAFRDGELMIVARGGKLDPSEKELAEMNQQLAKQAWMPVRGKLVARKRANGIAVIVTEGWVAAADDRDAGKGSGPTAIIERLNAAPTDAPVIAAASPSRPISGMTVNGAQSWLRISKTEIRIDGEIFVADKPAAAAVVAALRIGQKDLEGKVPGECKKAVTSLNARVMIDSGDTSVRISARWKPEEIGEAVMCGFAAAMKDAEWKEVE
ncbi:MAG TPA: hypothetical protein VM261_25220 [Kofleriaceae bacterium]|nr:hypothetical protein [Kofleriaceae bacterium]